MSPIKRNKPRLALALYARPKYPNSYHYALLVIPKRGTTQSDTTATKCHALDTLQNISGKLSHPWRYECAPVANLQHETWLLACVIFAKVVDGAALVSEFEGVPVYQFDDPDIAKAEAFDCVAWVRAAVERSRRSSALSSIAVFQDIEQAALEYVERKKSKGRWAKSGQRGKPILDLLQDRELVE